MNMIERHANDAIATGQIPDPLRLAETSSPVLATPALCYAALTFAAYMAGNVVTDFNSDESPIDGLADDLSKGTGEQLLSMRERRIHGV